LSKDIVVDVSNKQVTPGFIEGRNEFPSGFANTL